MPTFSVGYGKRLGFRPRSRPPGGTLKLRQPKTFYPEPPQGFEPWTPALRKRCTTTVLRWLEPCDTPPADRPRGPPDERRHLQERFYSPRVRRQAEQTDPGPTSGGRPGAVSCGRARW